MKTKYNNRMQQLYSVPNLFDSGSILYCGANQQYHRFVPELKQIMPECKIDVVEVVEKYVEWCKQSGYFDECYHSNIVDFYPTKHYDCILCLHLLEHLSLEEAKKVASRLKLHCDLFIAAVPWGDIPSLPKGQQAEGYDRHLEQYGPNILRETFGLNEVSVVGEADIPGNQVLGYWKKI